MADRIVPTDPAGATGIVYCDEGPFYGPLPPVDPDHAAIHARLVAAGIVPEPYAAPPAPPRLRSGRALRYALNAQGWRQAWETAAAAQAAAGKPDDLDYWATLGAGDYAPETSPKMARIAARAAPPVDLRALYDAAPAG